MAIAPPARATWPRAAHPGATEAPDPGSRRTSPPLRAAPVGLGRRAFQLVAFGALAVFVARRWTAQLDPAPTGRMTDMAAVAVVVAALAMLASARNPPRWCIAAGSAVTAAGALAGVVLLAGVADELVWVGHWDALASGLGDGLSALPDLRVPYRGDETWVRTVLELGGGLLLLAGAVALGAGRGRPLAATSILSLAFTIPVVTTKQAHPFLDGVIFAALAAVVAVGWRVPRARAPAAIVIGALALGAAALLAPRLDGGRPLVNYEHLGQAIKPPPTTIYNWDHSYEPLRWPRTGKELLRVRSSAPNYLKGVTLNRFDGLRWIHTGLVSPAPPDVQGNDSRHLDWRTRVSVTVGELRSRQVYAPGTITSVVRSSANVQPGPAGSFVASGRLLTRGDSYVADTYSPRPTKAEMSSASVDYGDTASDALRVELPLTVGGPPSLNPHTGKLDTDRSATILARPWGTGGSALHLASTGEVYDDGAQIMAASAYRRTWALAQRLRAASSSPYDLAERVQRRVRQGAVYDESPPRARVPLDTFLFDVRRGYCQQFSGAMALLLRMAGVPARVASGFAPGRRDRSRDEYIVTDLDAHSWVEVFFPDIGWVVFDPTPAAGSPAGRSADSTTAAAADAGDAGRLTPLAAPAGAADGGGGTPGILIALFVVTGAAGLALLVALVVDRRRRVAARAAGGPELAELLHALAVTGRKVEPGSTLGDLQRRFASSPDAGRYLGALVRGRFGGGAGPDAADRAALRRALAAGLGTRGAVRAWWALPPTRPARSR